MGQVARRQLDEDLERIVQTSGRAPIGGGLMCILGAIVIWAINRAANGDPGFLDIVASAVVVVGVAPALLVAGIRHRRAMTEWAEREQVERMPREARRRRPLTDKHATLPRAPRDPRDTEDGGS